MTARIRTASLGDWLFACLRAASVLFAMSALAFSARQASGAWATFGNQAATAVQNQVNAQAVSDGAGGMIIVWQDFRSGVADIYAQRFDASGTKLWGDGGLAVCTETLGQEAPVLTSDGAGGAVIAWQDLRSGAGYDIWAQAVTPAGALKWAPAGVAICTASGNQVLEVITTDAAGGAIIAWRDGRGVAADVYAQRVSSTGTPLWTGDGVAVCTATGQQNDISIVSNGQGGAFLAWRDPRNGTSNNDIYAQALNSSGTPLWTADGVVVTNAVQNQIDPSISYDGNLGVLIAWQDTRNATDYDIYAQRLNSTGTALWTPNGVQACDVDSAQSAPIVVSDGARGAILAWTDARVSRPDIYAQRLDSLGTRLWGGLNGVAVCSADSGQFIKTLIADKTGGAIVGWDDERGAGNDEDIYAQALSPTGTVRWTANGVKIATGSGTRRLTTSAPDGYGGALFAWEDFRNGATSDVFGLRVTSVGTGIETASAPRAAARLLTPYPNPFNPHTTIEFTLTEPSRFSLSIHDVQGRLVRSLGAGVAQAGTRTFQWDGTRNDGSACASGAYFAVLSLPSGTRSTSLRLIR
ncbi:MAG TPA: FlgD immunoglobulin-like domain containing protein [Candidatus Eisenbacteria bacterium]|nr:FlgD immunoglobulin-like domain containing protein [Candidatus Eisenbacteria bacterium]